MGDYKKTTKEIIDENYPILFDDVQGKEEWIRADHAVLKEDIKKEIDFLITFREKQMKNNTIYKMDSCQLNDAFITNLEDLKKVFGLLDDVQSGEGQTPEVFQNDVKDRLGGTPCNMSQQNTNGVSGLPTNKYIIDMNGYELAEWLHNKYEAISEVIGWDTQKSTKVSFKDLPEKNKSVMLNLAQVIQINLAMKHDLGLALEEDKKESDK